jgi:glycosyltransferase involved in cell wall biosynthesis
MLSVVIICKNEQRFIGRCIESVLKATTRIIDCEVVVVDSASTDSTIQVAQDYPVTIYQLTNEQRHTPAAGRHIGFLKTSGDFVLFLDGDSYLVEGFIEQAIDHFRNDPSVAAIIGRRKEIYYDYSWEKTIGEKKDINGISDKPEYILVAKASAIYSREALNKAGGFNPYLFSEEEAELSDRIRSAGMKVLGIPLDMVIHNTLPREKVKTHFERMKSNLHLGPGQILRYRMKEGISYDLFHAIGSGLYIIIWMLLGVFCLVISLAIGKPILVIGWVAVSLIMYTYLIAKQKSITVPSQYILLSTVQAYALAKGFLMRPLSPDSYPTDVKILKKTSIQ